MGGKRAKGENSSTIRQQLLRLPREASDGEVPDTQGMLSGATESCLKSCLRRITMIPRQAWAYNLRMSQKQNKKNCLSLFIMQKPRLLLGVMAHPYPQGSISLIGTETTSDNCLLFPYWSHAVALSWLLCVPETCHVWLYRYSVLCF